MNSPDLSGRIPEPSCNLYPAGSVWRARAFEFIAFVVMKVFGWLPRKRKSSDGGIRSVLLVEPFQMGDVLSLSVILQPLRDYFPHAKIIVLTQAKNKEVFGCDNRVDGTVVCPVPWATQSKLGSLREWLELWRTCSALRKQGGFDIGVDTRGEVRSQLLLGLCGCRRRAGYTNYMCTNMRIRGLLLTDNVGEAPKIHRYDINRWIIGRVFERELGPLKFPCLQADGIEAQILEPGRKQIVIHPGAGWVFKRWPEERWVETINALGARGDVCIVLVASAAESVLLESISNRLAVRHYARITTLSDLIGLLKGAALFIGLDSGPMNLAVVLGVRVLALFGPGNSRLWRPYPADSFFFHPGSIFPCCPCLQKECAFPEEHCMKKIGAAEVINQALKMLE